MTSELKVDKITPASGTNTQIGEAGDTTNLSAGTVTLPTSIITGASEKTTLVDADKFLIADSADSNAFKHVQKSNLPSGGFTKIHSIDASDSSNVNFDNNYVTSTYRTYLLICDGINNATDNTNFRLKLSTDNGSSFLSGISRSHVSLEDDDSSITISNSDEGASTVQIGSRGQGNATGEHGSGAIFIYGSQDSNSWININAQYVSWGNSMQLTWEDSAHGARSTDALNYIRAEMSSGNLTSGRFTLYGAN
jgi:hypothetical protein